MKKFVTILSAAVMLCIGTSAFAQSGLGIGFLNVSQLSRVSENSDPVSVGFNGFYIGLGHTAALAYGLTFTPGVYYEFLTSTDELAGIKTEINEHYVSVPLDLGIGFDVASFRLGFYAGPTVRVGIASNSKVNLPGGPTKTSRYGDGFDYSRLDLLVGGGVFFDLNNGIRLNAGFDCGLLDRDGSDLVSVRNNRLSIGAAYLF